MFHYFSFYIKKPIIHKDIVNHTKLYFLKINCNNQSVVLNCVKKKMKIMSGKAIKNIFVSEGFTVGKSVKDILVIPFRFSP